MIIPLYYLIGIFWVSKVDDDPAYTVRGTVPPGGSYAVAVTADLIDREVRRNGWVSNDPILFPGHFCDNMANYQQGMVTALSRFTIELNDSLGRARGSSEADPDLNQARQLSYRPDVWVWEPTKSIWPRETSESQYIQAASALRSYNTRVAANDAIFDRRADNLATTMERMASDLGSSSASLFAFSTENSGWYLFDWDSDDLFYQTKGRAYAYYILLRELRRDFDKVIGEKELDAAYDLMLENFAAAIALSPMVVINGSQNSLTVPNHLTTQGFYLLRARTQLREIVDILRA